MLTYVRFCQRMDDANCQSSVIICSTVQELKRPEMGCSAEMKVYFCWPWGTVKCLLKVLLDCTVVPINTRDESIKRIVLLDQRR